MFNLDWELRIELVFPKPMGCVWLTPGVRSCPRRGSLWALEGGRPKLVAPVRGVVEERCANVRAWGKSGSWRSFFRGYFNGVGAEPGDPHAQRKAKQHGQVFAL